MHNLSRETCSVELPALVSAVFAMYAKPAVQFMSVSEVKDDLIAFIVSTYHLTRHYES